MMTQWVAQVADNPFNVLRRSRAARVDIPHTRPESGIPTGQSSAGESDALPLAAPSTDPAYAAVARDVFDALGDMEGAWDLSCIIECSAHGYTVLDAVERWVLAFLCRRLAGLLWGGTPTNQYYGSFSAAMEKVFGDTSIDALWDRHVGSASSNWQWTTVAMSGAFITEYRARGRGVMYRIVLDAVEVGHAHERYSQTGEVGA
jgi:hypothetical protein